MADMGRTAASSSFSLLLFLGLPTYAVHNEIVGSALYFLVHFADVFSQNTYGHQQHAAYEPKGNQE